MRMRIVIHFNDITNSQIINGLFDIFGKINYRLQQQYQSAQPGYNYRVIARRAMPDVAISSTVEGCRTNQLTSYIRDCRC